MSLHPHHNGTAASVDLLSAIDELAENNKSKVNRRRGNNRVEVNCVARVVPANASERGKFVIEGQCRDVSPTGGRLILDQALLVGDVYLVYIEDEHFSIDPTFVRCLRCHLIREGDFECGVSFLSPVDLDATFSTAVPATLPQQTDSPTLQNASKPSAEPISASTPARETSANQLPELSVPAAGVSATNVMLPVAQPEPPNSVPTSAVPQVPPPSVTAPEVKTSPTTPPTPEVSPTTASPVTFPTFSSTTSEPVAEETPKVEQPRTPAATIPVLDLNPPTPEVPKLRPEAATQPIQALPIQKKPKV